MVVKIVLGKIAFFSNDCITKRMYISHLIGMAIQCLFHIALRITDFTMLIYVQEVYWNVRERKTPVKVREAGLGQKRNGTVWQRPQPILPGALELGGPSVLPNQDRESGLCTLAESSREL